MAMEAPIRKLRLRRLGQVLPPLNPEQDGVSVQKNLEKLKANVDKKKRAQEIYYENHSNRIHVSPMNRDFNRKPVKQRLGRKIPFNGTNTSAIPPKHRLLRVNRPGTMNNSINARKIRNTRFSAQQRLNQIRARHQNSLIPTTGGIRRLRLKRTLTSISNGLIDGTPKNLRVEVRNELLYDGKFHQDNNYRFRMILNDHLQLEIKRMQLRFKHVGPRILPMKVSPVATKISTSARFANLE